MTIETKQEHWLTHIKQWEESELSQQVYCKRSGINLNSFTYWRGKFLSSVEQKVKPGFVPIKIASNPVLAGDAKQSIQIKLLTGHIVYVPTNVDINDIARLISLLGVPHA
ncbi:MAG: IS66 family insertion sequence element accessory protein TnpA [Gammaproteobacteria bacterium]